MSNANKVIQSRRDRKDNRYLSNTLYILTLNVLSGLSTAFIDNFSVFCLIQHVLVLHFMLRFFSQFYES